MSVSFLYGKDGVLKVGSADLSIFTDNVDFSDSGDVGETSVFGVEAKTYASGLTDATFSATGKYDVTATTGTEALIGPLVGSDTVSTFEIGPGGSTTGMPKLTGNCFITSYKRTAPVGGIIIWTADFQVSGAVTRATYS